MSSDAIVTIIVSVFGGGALGALAQAVGSWRKGVRDADVARDQSAIQGFRELAERLSTEVDSLRERLDRVEAQITVERDLRWTAIQYARSLLVWIAHHLPDETPPEVPTSLSDHISTPRKDNR